MIPLVIISSIIPLVGDFLTGEYFLVFGDPTSLGNDQGQVILKVDDKDNVKERHYNGTVVTGTSVVHQEYYDAISETEVDIKPPTGKEWYCVFWGDSSGGGQFSSGTWKLWANTTIDSKSGARDIFNTNWTTSSIVQVPPFVLKAGEYLNLERVSGSDTNVFMRKFVAVERDET